MKSEKFNGLGINKSNLCLLSDARSRSITAENPTGEPGQGAMLSTGYAEKQAQELGLGWKVNPATIIAPHTTKVIADINDMGSIQSMWCTGHISRNLILRIYWDNQENPSVEVPYPDFFANGYCDNREDLVGGKFQELVSEMVCLAPFNAMNCFWEMPFRSRCLMTLENIGDEDHHLYYQINYQLTDIPDNAAYFHASFRRTNPVPFKEVHTIIDGIEGEGHFVGTAMCVGLNGAAGWWGEGEVKFYIDDDSEFPTICGTGLEDYFMGAFNWETDKGYTTYCTPYGGMHRYDAPDGLYKIQPRFSLYRWHVKDPIRFKKGLKVTIQDLGWKNYGSKAFNEDLGSRRYLPRQDDFATVAFWYQTMPFAKLKPLPSKEELTNY